MVCDKVSYSTYKEAIDAINRISGRQKQSFKTYKCSDCGKFHITSIKAKKLNPVIDLKFKKNVENYSEDAGIKFIDKKIKVAANNIPLTPKRIFQQVVKPATFKLGELLKIKK